MSPFDPLGIGRNTTTDSNSSSTTTTALTSPSLITYIVGVQGARASYLHYTSSELFLARCSSAPPDFQPGKLYCLRWSHSSPGESHFSALSERAIKSYTHRGDFTFTGVRFDNVVLKSLILGCRIRDYERRCGVITQRSPFAIRMPVNYDDRRDITKERFRTDAGVDFDVTVNHICRGYDGESCMLFCEPLTTLPSGLAKNSRIHRALDDDDNPSLVTKALERFCGREEIDNRIFLDMLYGEEASFSHPSVDPTLITLETEEGDFVLSPDRSQAVRMSNSSCPGYAIEEPPGPGRRMTIAGIATHYTGPGVQLLLSIGNTASFELAKTLAGINCGSKSIGHLVSADEVDKHKQESLYDMNLENMINVEDLDDVSDEMIFDSNQLKTRWNRAEKRINYDIIVLTLDKLLTELLKTKVAGDPCPLQHLLETQVRRIVITEGNRLPEAALIALVLLFRLAQIIVVGHPADVKPVNYTRGEAASEMADRPALEVLKRKRNVPYIKIRSSYNLEELPRPRQPAAMSSRSRHYENMVHQVRLARNFPDLHESDAEEQEPEPPLVAVATPPAPPNFILSIFKSLSRHCINIDARLPGNGSIFNDEEASTLQYVLAKLREIGFAHETVNVIAYHNGRLEHAEMRMPTEPHAAGVDLELSSEVSSRTAALFSSNSRLSGQDPALIILGPETIRRTAPWQTLVSGGHFAAVVAAARL